MSKKTFSSKQGFANILLIVLVVALVGALGYVTWVKKPATEIVATPTPTSSPNLQVTPIESPSETANWKTYSASGIQFKYPSDWQIETKKVGVKTEATFLIPKKENNFYGDIFEISYVPNQGGLTLKEWWAEASKTDVYKKDSEKILSGVTAYFLIVPESDAPARYVFITKSPSLIIDIAAVGESVKNVLATLKVGENMATSPMPQITYPDVNKFLPSKAILNQELKLDLEGDGIEEVAFAYAIPLNKENNDFTTGVRILKYVDSGGWNVAFEDTDRVGNGGGPKGTVSIEKVSGPNNKDAVLVVLTESGAGTATRWHLIASVSSKTSSGKTSKLDPSSIRQKVLTDRGYQDDGYNGVKSTGNFVVETQPGFSKDTARCCPDKPTIEIKFRFTGNSIELDSVKELEFKPQN